MYPQYEHRRIGGEIAIWLLLTVGALLIPIIIIAVCCIRRHWRRRPRIKLMENRYPRMKMTSKQSEVLRSYDGPYTESDNITRTNSLKNPHVHWPDVSISAKNEQFHSVKPLPEENTFNTTMLAESPSTHHHRPVHSALFNFIQTAIIPAGSMVNSTDASRFITLSKEFTSISPASNSVM